MVNFEQILQILVQFISRRKDYPYTLPLNVDMHVNRVEALALSTSSTNPPALPEVVKVDISIFLKTSF